MLRQNTIGEHRLEVDKAAREREEVSFSVWKGVNPCEARKIKASQILHKIISTHLLTVLTKHVILHAEQRKREKRNPKIPLK